MSASTRRARYHVGQRLAVAAEMMAASHFSRLESFWIEIGAQRRGLVDTRDTEQVLSDKFLDLRFDLIGGLFGTAGRPEGVAI